MRLLVYGLVALVLAAALPACSRAPQPLPATAGPRLVVLSPALAVTLKGLGLADHIVGRHGYDLALDPGIPVCGDQAGIDYESLLRVNPTHVLIEWGSRPLPSRLEELAAQHHWTIRNYTLLTLDQVRAVTQELTGEFQAPGGPGERTTGSLTTEMDRAWSRRAQGFADAGRVLLLHSTSPPAALGPGSFHQQILERIGGTPAVTSGAPFIELDAEDVLRLAPDAIVLVNPRARDAPARGVPLTPEELSVLLGPLSGLDLPAVKNGRVALIDDPLCALPSTSMIGFADELARILDGWSNR